MYCPKCGKPISEDDTFCPHCGNKIEARPAVAEVSFGRRFEEDSRGEVRETSAVAAKPASLVKIIILLILSIVGCGLCIMGMIASMTLFIEGDHLSADATATNVVLFFAGAVIGLTLCVLCFTIANKMGRENQPHKPLQIMMVIFASIGLGLGIVALVFQGVILIV